MKKRNILSISLMFIFFLLLGIVTNNAVINLILYNQNLNLNININSFILDGVMVDESTALVIWYFCYIFIFALTGVISFIFSKLFCKAVKNKVYTFENKKNLKNAIIILTLLAYIVSNIIICIKLKQYNFDASNRILEWNENYYNKVNLDDGEKVDIVVTFLNYLNFPSLLNLWNFAVLIISLIPTVFVLKNLFDNKVKSKNKVKTKVASGLNSICIIIFLICNIYYYIDIPEFKYFYRIDEENVTIFGYADNRDMLYNNTFFVPEEIWNKKVTNLNSFTKFWANPDMKIIIPNTINWDTFWVEDKGLYYGYKGEIIMDGAPITWFIEDNIAYNIDKTEAYILNRVTANKFNIPATVKRIENISIFIFSEMEELTIEEGNPSMCAFDNILYIKNYENISDAVENIKENNSFVGILNMGVENVKMPDVTADSVIWIKASKEEVNIILPATMKTMVNDIIINRSEYEYIVEEGNMFYSYEEGILYNKDRTNIIDVIPKKYREKTFEIVDTVKEINDEVLINLKNSRMDIIVSEDNPYIKDIKNGIIEYKN